MGEPVSDAIDSGASFPMKMPAGWTDHGQRLVPERFGARQPFGQAGERQRQVGVQVRPAGPEPNHRDAMQHEAKIDDAVFDQFEADIAVVKEKEFHPALERAAGFGRKPEMHLQANQRAVASVVDAPQAQLPGRQHEMSATDRLAVIAKYIPSRAGRRYGDYRLHRHV